MSEFAEKVIAYITKGDQLLVFHHPQHPEAGIQVPAGTIEKGESPRDAVLREAFEETGLYGLEIDSYLGVQEFDLVNVASAGIQRRHFFQLGCTDKTSAKWRHFEEYPSDGTAESIEFEFYWVKFPEEVPELLGGLDEMLPLLKM